MLITEDPVGHAVVELLKMPALLPTLESITTQGKTDFISSQMLRNHVLIAVRNLSRNKAFTIINILGLSIGLTAFILIALYVHYELSYDNFHADKKNIYRVTTTVRMQDEVIARESNTYAGVIRSLKQEYTGVKSTTVISAFDSENTFLRFKDQQGNAVPLKGYHGLYADASFFEVFSFPIASDAGNNTLNKPYSAVISETFAREYFQDEALGKTLEFKDDDSPPKLLTITGIMKDVPANSHVRFDVVIHLPEEEWTFWDWAGHAYVRLGNDTDPKSIEAHLNSLAIVSNGLKKNIDDYGQVSTFSLQSLDDIHLYSRLEGEFEQGGSGMVVYALAILAILILAIGWINYITLSTAIYTRRLRQLAIRKIVGASKSNLIIQILTETALLNFISLVVALALSWMLMPAFASLIGITNHVLDLSTAWVWTAALMFFVISTLVSGGHPALSMGTVHPALAMKGKVGRAGGVSLRKALVTFQFATATTLIVITLAAYRQLTFMQSQELGINIEHVLAIKALNFDQETWSDSVGGFVIDDAYQEKARSFLDDLRNRHDIVNAASLSHLPGQLPNWGTEFKPTGIGHSNAYSLKAMGVDYDLIPTLGATLLAGRNFSREYNSDRGNEKKRAIIINETASKLLGFGSAEEAVSGHLFTYWGADYEIIGVVRSFHQTSLKDDLTPLYFVLRPRALSYFAINIRSENISGTVSEIKSVWKRHFPDYPFEYLFLNEFFNNQYHREVKFTNVVSLFTALAIFIACMGLYGVTSYAIAQRTKEIGIRKALGASVTNVIGLFLSSLVKHILLANFIVMPATYYAILVWLDNYAYRTTPVWWAFAGPVMMIVLLALLTVCLQTVKVAVRNPVESLKCE